MYALSQWQIEENRVNSINSQCAALERQCQTIAKEIGTDTLALKNRSLLVQDDLKKFLAANPGAKTSMDNWGDPERTKHATNIKAYSSSLEAYQKELNEACNRLVERRDTKRILNQITPLAKEIDAICSYCKLERKTKATDSLGLKELNGLFNKYKQLLPGLRDQKKKQMRENIERKISMSVSNFKLEDKKKITSARQSSSPNKSMNKKARMGNSWDLGRHKELGLEALEGLTDLQFATERINELDCVLSQAQFVVWLETVKRQKATELLKRKADATQTTIALRLPELPDCPTKNTISYAIEDLGNYENLSNDYDSWDATAAKKRNNISAYLDNILASQNDRHYVTDNVLEVLALQGIVLDTRNYVEGQSMNVVSAKLGNTSLLGGSITSVSANKESGATTVKDEEKDIIAETEIALSAAKQLAAQAELMRQQRLLSAKNLQQMSLTP
jgi:hypothetical protein